MECREVREYLPAYVDQMGGPKSADVDAHLQTCAGCRAELEQYREMQSELATLSAQTIEPPAWLLGTLTETVAERAAQRAAIRNTVQKVANPKVVVTGGALVVAGVAGIVLMSRRRRRRGGIARRLREAIAEA